MTTPDRARDLRDSAIAHADGIRALPATRRYKALSYALVPLATRDLLDLGAGTGDDVLALGERLGGAARLTGVDAADRMVHEARRRARNVALEVRFVAADVGALPFGDGQFDVVRADVLLSELEDDTRALAEAFRVVRAGGLLLVHDRATTESPRRPVTQAIVEAGFALLRVHPLELPHDVAGISVVATKPAMDAP